MFPNKKHKALIPVAQSFIGVVVAGKMKGLFLIMKKHATITPTGLKPVRVPLYPIRWVHTLPGRPPVATLALAQLLKSYLKLN